METITKHYTVLGNDLVPSLDLLFHKMSWVESNNPIIKSASSKTSEFNIIAYTYSDMNRLNVRQFALNELEAEYDLKLNQLRSITLRDTDVHKKVTFTLQGGILTYVHGQDTVGKISEIKNSSVKEPIAKIIINNQEYSTPFNLGNIYKGITGLSFDDITDEELKEEQMSNNLWSDFMELLNRGEK